MPRCHRQGQEDFVLHQLGHIQFANHRQKIPGIVFQLVLRQVGTFRNEFQQVVDIKIEGYGFQAALADQRQDTAHRQVKQAFTALTVETLKAVLHLSVKLGQQVMQALQVANGECSLENTAIPSECESV